MNRKPFTIVGAAAAITGAGLLSLAGFSHVAAWGNGQICWYGQTYTFQTEQAYYAFLRTHPHATEGTCVTTTTAATTTTVPETTTTQPEVTTTTQPEQTTTTVAETTTTVAETTTTAPETTIPETTVPVTTVPETTVPATSTTAVAETTQPSDTTSPAIVPPADTQAPSQGRGELPHTGPDDAGTFAAVGLAALLGGSALVFVARRRKGTVQ